jgi:hypothetical protein
MPGVFVIVRDARGSLVHVRRRSDGECVGCIEVGLYEIVRAVVLGEGTATRPTEGIRRVAAAVPCDHRTCADQGKE